MIVISSINYYSTLTKGSCKPAMTAWHILIFLICSSSMWCNVIMAPATSSLRPHPCHFNLADMSVNCYDTFLQTVPTDLPVDVRKLDLSFNKIRYLSNGSFTRYPLLVHLYVRRNGMVSVDNGAFYTLRHLRLLDLNENEHIQLPSGILTQSYQLYRFSCNSCIMTAIPGGLLRHFLRLQQLELMSNNLFTVNITSCPAGDMMSINLSENQIEKLAPETFTMSCKISILVLDKNPVHSYRPRHNCAIRCSANILSLNAKKFSNETWNDLFTGIARSPIKKSCCIWW